MLHLVLRSFGTLAEKMGQTAPLTGRHHNRLMLDPPLRVPRPLVQQQRSLLRGLWLHPMICIRSDMLHLVVLRSFGTLAGYRFRNSIPKGDVPVGEMRVDRREWQCNEAKPQGLQRTVAERQQAGDPDTPAATLVAS